MSKNKKPFRKMAEGKRNFPKGGPVINRANIKLRNKKIPDNPYGEAGNPRMPRTKPPPTTNPPGPPGVDATNPFSQGNIIIRPTIETPFGLYGATSHQQFIYIMEISLDGRSVSSDDWLGVFNGATLCGAKQWNQSLCNGGVCDLSVYGNDGSANSHPSMGDILTFKFYDFSKDVIIDNDRLEFTNPTQLQFASGGIGSVRRPTPTPWDFSYINNLVLCNVDKLQIYGTSDIKDIKRKQTPETTPGLLRKTGGRAKRGRR